MDATKMSLKERFACLPQADREAWLESQEPDVLEEIVRGAWWWEARPTQVPPPGEWFVFLALAGRGWGKTRAGAEWIVERSILYPLSKGGIPTEHLIVAETLADAKNICVEGDSGVLNALTRRALVRDVDYKYRQSPRPSIQFANGVKIHCEGADDADVGRGHNLASAWLDELIKWPVAMASYDEGIVPALRVDVPDEHPRIFVTTTPKANSPLLRRFLKEAEDPNPQVADTISIVRGATFENRSLSAYTARELKKRYEGTAIGRQELYGEVLELEDGALFSASDLEACRVTEIPADKKVISIVVGVDPAQVDDQGNVVDTAYKRRSGENHDEMGVIVVARTDDDDLWVLADESIQSAGRPAALHAWRTLLKWDATKVVYEANLGKAWMSTVFHDAWRELQRLGEAPADTQPPMEPVDAKLGKKTRGEPVAMRSQQHRFHLVGRFVRLEDQMTMFTSWESNKESPDRLDGLVHGCRYHMLNERKKAKIVDPYSVAHDNRHDGGLGLGYDFNRWVA
jgi:phage terminase large subunit-like protein